MASRTKDNDFSKIKLTEDELESKKKRERELQALELKNKRERMIARIELEEKEKLLPRKRKRKNKHSEQTTELQEDNDENDNDDDDQLQRTSFSEKSEKYNRLHPKEQKKVNKKPPPPPTIDFQNLLKVASMKQFEPVKAEIVKTEGRPLTKKEKRALEEEEARARRRIAAEAASKNGLGYSQHLSNASSKTKSNNQSNSNSHNSNSNINSNKMKSVKDTSQSSAKKMHPVQKPSDIRNKPKTSLNKNSKEERSKIVQEHRKQSNNTMNSSKSFQSSNNLPKSSAPSSNTMKKMTSTKYKDDPDFLQGPPKTSQNLPKKVVNNINKNASTVKYKEDSNFLQRQPTDTNMKVGTNRKEINNVKVKPRVNEESISNQRTMVSQNSKPTLSTTSTDDFIAQIENRIREKLEKELEEKMREKFATQMASKFQNSHVPNRTDISAVKKNNLKDCPRSLGQNTSSNRDIPRKKPISQPIKNKTPPSRAFHPNPYLLPPRRLLESQRPSKLPKRRIESDDDDEDDDDMDDFIDNSSVNDNEDYSKYIKEIFNYDRSRFGDDEDDDIPEATFEQVCKEEIKSAKLGYLEDLEEEKKEKEALQRKAIKKKQMKLQRK